jgi:DNA-binding IclR family transcriptional regulator
LPVVPSVAAAVLDHAGHPEAGVAVTFPSAEADERRITHFASLVMSAAAEISRRIGA